MIIKSPYAARIEKIRRRKFDNALRIERTDPAHLSILSPHFDPTNANDIIRFLDHAEECFRNERLSQDAIAFQLEQMISVLHESKYLGEDGNWQAIIDTCRQHRVLATLHEDVFVKRAYDKPRNYPGDAVLMDYIYDQEMHREPPEMTDVGKRLHRWTTNCSACNGVKARRSMIARMIDQLAERSNKPEVLSFACGHLRESELSSAILRRKLYRLVAIDADEKSIAVVDKDYSQYGIETAHINAREMLTARVDFGQFDLIYSAGLFDYLQDSACTRLVSRWFSMLKPGGQLLLTNFLDGIEGVGFMEAFMDWNLIYRSRIELMQLTEEIDECEVSKVTSFAEENCNIVCVLLEKAS